PVLFRETCLPSPDSANPMLYIDAGGGKSRFSPFRRAGDKRSFEEISECDEDGYARARLGSNGGVFFRAADRTPRSFAWRVLEDGKVLELQPVDLMVHKKPDGRRLTFRIDFGQTILNDGVAFADPEAHDALEVFVLTAKREVCTVTLRKDVLTRTSVPADFNSQSCVKRFGGSFLSMRQPFRFRAASNVELMASSADGGLVLMHRDRNESGAQWQETYFNERGWSGALTLKKLNFFATQVTVRWGGVDLDPNAIADMVRSPDANYIWTLSVDYYLRAWNTQTGKVDKRLDIAYDDQDRVLDSILMVAEQDQLLQLIPRSETEYLLVVHLPRERCFKAYRVLKQFTSVDATDLRIELVRIRTPYLPAADKLVNGNVWQVEKFHLDMADLGNSRLWVRARSGPICHTFTINLDMRDLTAVACHRDSGWTRVHSGFLTPEELKAMADFPGDLDPVDDSALTPTESWLSFLFYPGRFSTAGIMAALHMYRKGRGLSVASLRPGEPLQEQVVAAITAKQSVRRMSNDWPDYMQHKLDLQTQWTTFYSLLSHLHSRRHESLGFAYDDVEGLAWTVYADCVAPVRACSELEMCCFNTHLLEAETGNPSWAFSRKIYSSPGSVEVSRIIDAARELRLSFSYTARSKLDEIVARDALDVPENGETLTADIAAACDLRRDVSDEDIDELVARFSPLGGVGALNDEMVLNVLEWLENEWQTAGPGKDVHLTRPGIDATVEIARETLQRAKAVLLDICALLACVVGIFELQDLDPSFNADRMYLSALDHSKRVDILLWLVDNTVAGGITLLETIFLNEWQCRSESSMPWQLTLSSKSWLGDAAFRESGWEGFTAHILSHLLKHQELDLAVDFLKFTPEEPTTPWLLYLQGRLYLSQGSYNEAAALFTEAAPDLSTPTAHSPDTSHLLSASESIHFFSGLAQYYQHISTLYESLSLYSYVATFSTLALSHTDPLPPNFSASMSALDRTKASTTSPLRTKLDAVETEMRLLRIKEERTEILSRLYNAYKQTHRFSEALASLSQIEDLPIKKSALKQLVEVVLKTSPSLLLELGFGDAGVEDDVDGILSGLSSPGVRKLVYAYRVKVGRFRDAAEALWEETVALTREGDLEELIGVYTLLINTLVCCQEAWFLVRENGRRRLVEVGDLRRELGALLDRREDGVRGR
ncbi:hypothetical protein K470DRAFT_198959, partial [Piedraia hortae CBS 480.64]